MADTYIIQLSRSGSKERVIPVLHCTEQYIRNIVNKSFKGRFSKPSALRISDGVKLIVSSAGKNIFGRRIYNKSILQVEVELRKAIRKTPL